MAPAAARAGQALTFRVGAARLALGAGTVSEIIRTPALTRVPHAPAGLAGLANLRGAVLPVVSLAALLGRAGGRGARVIVLDRVPPVGLAVDEVSALVDPDAIGEAQVIDAGALLDRAFAAAPRRAAAAPPAPRAQVDAEQGSETIALLVFAVGGQEFALPLAQVEEVLRPPANVAAIPHGDASVVGAAAHRGGVLPLLALRVLLGLGGSSAGAGRRVVVVRIGTRRVGLVVDAVRAIARVGEAAIDMVPAVLARGGAEAAIQAICRLDGGRRLVAVLAADRLVHADVAARAALETAEGESGMAAGDEHADAAEPFVIFRIGQSEFGLPAGAVEEIARVPDTLMRLPRAPAFVRGVMNLRGRIVPVIDQSRRFGEVGGADRRRRIIVVRLDATLAGFVVDEVTELLRVTPDRVRAAPDLAGEDARVIDRVANLARDGRMILLMDPRELIDHAERDLLAALASENTGALG